jgi:hypothetical protein
MSDSLEIKTESVTDPDPDSAKLKLIDLEGLESKKLNLGWDECVRYPDLDPSPETNYQKAYFKHLKSSQNIFLTFLENKRFVTFHQFLRLIRSCHKELLSYKHTEGNFLGRDLGKKEQEWRKSKFCDTLFCNSIQRDHPSAIASKELNTRMFWDFVYTYEDFEHSDIKILREADDNQYEIGPIFASGDRTISQTSLLSSTTGVKIVLEHDRRNFYKKGYIPHTDIDYFDFSAASVLLNENKNNEISEGAVYRYSFFHIPVEEIIPHLKETHHKFLKIFEEGNLSREDRAKRIANFTQWFLFTQPFTTVNMSLVMMMVNTLLKHFGYEKGLSHGILDFCAFRMQENEFEDYFISKLDGVGTV